MSSTEVQSPEPDGRPARPTEGVSKSPGRKERSMRPRYIARACKECKRRKVKCNGQTPCHHCDRYDVQCLYPEKNKHDQAGRSSQMEMMREQLELLQQQVSLLVSRQILSEKSRPPPPPPPPVPALIRSPRSVTEMRVPSSSPAVQLRVGVSPKNLEELQHDASIMNSMPAENNVAASLSSMDTGDDRSIGHSSASTNLKSSIPSRLAVTCHPLLSISLAEALRLIDTYEDECGSVYPLIDIEHLRYFTTQFYNGVAASQTPATWRTFRLEQSSKRPFNTLEIVLAIALVIEGRGSTELGCALMDELEAEIDHRPSGVSAEISLAEILTLMSLYHFYRDEEVLAWRTIGLAARIALKMGLHLRDPPFAMFQGPQERERANQLFWCIYCLDRRWSFGTGLPFGIQEDDIDPSLPEPDDSHPYVFTSMIAYSRIGSKILKAWSSADHREQLGKREETAFLTYQVQQWYSSLDAELRIDDDQDLVLESLSPARNRLRVLNCLRKNQLHMLVHRRALFTPTSITADPRGAKAAVDFAKATIMLLDKLRNISDIYSCHAACFNYFLYSALTVILLAAYHGKAQFHEYCRDEFHMAVNLIGGVSAKSNVARKLWKIIKHLKIMGPENGVLPYMETQEPHGGGHFEGGNPKTASQNLPVHAGFLSPPQESPNAAQGMNGFGSGIMYGETGFFGRDYAVDGSMLSSELSDLFQAIDPSRYAQIPSQMVDQQQQRSQPSTFQMARNVF